MRPITKATYRKARADYEAVIADNAEKWEAIYPLYDNDRDKWEEGAALIESETHEAEITRTYLSARADLLGELYNQAKEAGGDLSPFGSPSLSVRDSLISLALRA
jgi:hypothetical protein